MTKRKSQNIIHSIENRFDFWKSWLRNKRKNFDPIHIMPYLTFGSEKVVHIKGRVLENKGITGALPSDSVWKNLSNMYKRFESDEVQNGQLKIRFANQVFHIHSDEEGYFELNFTPENLSYSNKWQEAEIEIVDAPIPFTKDIKYVSRILIPSPGCEYGIISDIDDTIVRTHATSFFKMFTTTFLNNAESRFPFEGVAELYEAFQAGTTENENPLFYVSSSPWNLYDMLLEFLITHKIPTGPLLLKDYGINDTTMLTAGHHAHKYYQIKRILETYPSLKFILVGDSGQEDAAIYSQVIQDFPDRILVAYIRDVNIPKHQAKVLAIQEKRTDHKVPLLLIKDSLAAAIHAAENNLINSESLEKIRNKF